MRQREPYEVSGNDCCSTHSFTLRFLSLPEKVHVTCVTLIQTAGFFFYNRKMELGFPRVVISSRILLRNLMDVM